MRFFNTAGPCMEQWHYMLPAAERLADVPMLVERGMYFVVHAPRQTGKTTTLMALARQLTASGKYAALHFSCEAGEVPEDDYVEAQRAVLTAMRVMARVSLPADLQPPQTWPEESLAQLLFTGLSAWASTCPRPLVLFFDEIDALRGKGLQSVLRQLRAGYSVRPHAAPWAVALCGLRDVRDHKAASGGDTSRLGTSSPFNIKVDSLRLGEFTAAQVAALYAQHTADTGQPFTEDAAARAFALTCGQPWLVNALARELVDKMRIAPPEPITAEHVDQAKERLILARATHLDSLVARLDEARVRRVIEPLLAGGDVAPQLVLMAYLQSIVNGTGFLDREYGVGRGRIDLQLRWPYHDRRGERQWQREAVEIKVWRDKKPDPLAEGLRQLDEYLSRLGLGHDALVMCDRRHAGSEAGPAERIAFEHAGTAAGRAVIVLRA